MNPTELRLRIWEMVFKKFSPPMIDLSNLEELDIIVKNFDILAERIYDKIKNPEV